MNKLIKNQKVIKNKWTNEEVQILKSYVERYPSNLTVAFEHAAEKVNHSVRSISQYYYKYIKGQNKLFTMNSKSYKANNSKNDKQLRTVNEKSTELVELVSELMNKLTNSQKIQVIKNTKF